MTPAEPPVTASSLVRPPYRRELHPASLATALVFAGVMPPDLTQPFCYLEVGCGDGARLTADAAEYPHGTFIGLEDDDALRATAQAATRGLNNLRVAPTAEADTDAAPIDILVLNDVWPRLDRHGERRWLDVIAARLAPCGLLVIDTAAPPGAAVAAAVGRLVAEAPGAEIQDKLAFAHRVQAAGSAFFAAHPSAAAVLEAWAAASDAPAPVQVTPLARLAAALQPLSLSFAGPARMADAIPTFHFSPAALTLLQAEPDAIRRETIADLLVNRVRRCDMFGRGLRRLDPAAAAATLAHTRFAALTSAASGAGLRLRTAFADIEPNPATRAVLAAVQAQPATPADLGQRLGAGPDGLRRAIESLLVLTALEAVRPLPAAAGAAAD